jgi:hypothetical protein
MADKEKKIKVDVDVDIKGKNKVDDLNDSLKGLGESGGKLPGVFGDVSEGAKGMAEGIMGTTKAAVAFLATPIGLALGVLVTVLASVKAAFDTNQDVMDTFNKGMAEVKASAGVATNVLGKFGTVVVDLFTDTSKVGDAWDKFTDSVMNYTENVAKATLIAKYTAEEKAKMIIKERDNVITNLKLEEKIASNREEIADKENHTVEERQNMIKEALASNKELYDNEDEMLLNKQKLLNIEMAYRRTLGDLTNAEEQQITDMDAAVLQSTINRDKANKTLKKQSTTIDKEEAARIKTEQKAATEEWKKSQAEKKAELKAEADEERKVFLETEKNRIEALKGSDKEEAAINAAILQRDIDAGDQSIEKVKALAEYKKKVKEEEDKADKKTYEDKLKLLEAESNDVKNTTDQKLAYLKQIEDLELSQTDLIENAKLTIIQKYQDEVDKVKEEAAKKEKERKLKEINETDKVANEALGSAQNLADTVFELKDSHLKKGSVAALEAAKKEFKINKALQLTGAIINGAKAITTSLASSPVAIGPIPNPAGIASLSMAIVSTAASLAKISATQFTGGETSGSAGGNGPSSNAGGGSFIPQNLQGIGGGTSGINNPNAPKPATQPTKPQPQKVYVVSSEMTGSQNKDAVLARRASFNR